MPGFGLNVFLSMANPLAIRGSKSDVWDSVYAMKAGYRGSYFICRVEVDNQKIPERWQNSKSKTRSRA